ncbi:hypothetical protein T265_09995 [Opisthorchis viverrini]|uniref:Uncharacterized protein n=1 Tax=Opisthorchis viverrini TaxID=6198 RepID=A0A074Z876_OPIVI|nr:hypothetical protein T265_09995 [Opisthorchis viverrini]KER21757.1 hypothetical protein T265_09995 [Opisthorchis viverrini]
MQLGVHDVYTISYCKGGSCRNMCAGVVLIKALTGISTHLKHRIPTPSSAVPSYVGQPEAERRANYATIQILCHQRRKDAESAMSDGSWKDLHKDDWKNVREHLYRKKTASLKRRQLEVLIRSETVRDLYHDVVESIIDLYKDSGTGLHPWQHFRAAADKLAELHKFMKLTVARVYALGTAEGAATYSYDFFEKLRDVQAHSNSPTPCRLDFEALRLFSSVQIAEQVAMHFPTLTPEGQETVFVRPLPIEQPGMGYSASVARASPSIDPRVAEVHKPPHHDQSLSELGHVALDVDGFDTTDVNSGSHQFIPFDYLRGYLSQPDDPLPKRMRRNKRTARRRQRRYSNIKPNSSSNLLLTDSQTPACAHIPSELHVRQPNPSSSGRVADQCEKGQVSQSDALLPVLSNFHSSRGEAESYLSEDSSGASLCSCACGDDSFTDTSSSANEEDEADFHRGRSTASRPTVGSTSGPPPFSPSS